MAIVECHADMICTAMSASESLDDYYRMLNTRIDTVNAHGRLTGHHPKLNNKHLTREYLKAGLEDDCSD